MAIIYPKGLKRYSNQRKAKKRKENARWKRQRQFQPSSSISYPFFRFSVAFFFQPLFSFTVRSPYSYLVISSSISSFFCFQYALFHYRQYRLLSFGMQFQAWQLAEFKLYHWTASFMKYITYKRAKEYMRGYWLLLLFIHLVYYFIDTLLCHSESSCQTK